MSETGGYYGGQLIVTVGLINMYLKGLLVLGVLRHQ